MPDADRWRIAVDTGGTFTDCLAVAPDGSERAAKVLTSSSLRGSVAAVLSATSLSLRLAANCPAAVLPGLRLRPLGTDHPGVAIAAVDGERLELVAATPWPLAPGDPVELVSAEPAPLLAARIVTATAHDAALPPLELRLATTLGTNALLERRGGPVALFTTRGFADLLAIGTQQRPDLFALAIEKPPPLAAATVEVDERLAADGAALRAVDLERLAADAAPVLARGIRSAAVALLHSYSNPAHERAVVTALRDLGFDPVIGSAELAPLIGLLERAQTAAVDAYLAPTIERYLDRIHGQLGGGRLQVMTSAGGLVGHADYRAKDSLLSGPAGGVAGAAAVGRRLGIERILGFDMGGTSTDVARWDGRFEYRFEQTVGDATLIAPSLRIETVAAGGGTVCWFDGHQLRVGPMSAGADPGPACYGAGGPLTITDVNLLLGRLDPDRMAIPVAPAAAAAALAALREDVARAGDAMPTDDELLTGLLDIVDETMAGAVRRISVGRGHDPSGHALVAFGGAGGQHITSVARRLGATTVVIPAGAGLLSAHGVAAAEVERFAVRQVLRPLAEMEATLEEICAELAAAARAALGAEGYGDGEIAVRRRMCDLRYAGQESSVTVEIAPGAAVTPLFERAYDERFGYLPEGRAVELVSVRVVAQATAERKAPAAPSPADTRRAVKPARTIAASVAGDRRPVAVFERDQLAPGDTLAGPALVVEAHATTVVDDGWRCEVAATGDLVLRATGVARAADASLEVARLELFTGRFDAIAQEMGELLRRTAISTNVKERRDYSCALLDTDGQLVVNAPHIPVHLGSLGPCVRAVRAAVALDPGDSVVTNHPAFGGSHLPDVTVVTPIHVDETLLGYVASRAHHAELGGTHPGSMPPRARTLAEEGVVIRPVHIERAGRDHSAAVRELLSRGPFPSRAVDENLQDLRAALAANRHGAERLRELARRHGPETVTRYMAALADRAEARMRRALRRLDRGRHEAVDALDDGAVIRVAIDVGDGAATIDFAGSAPVHPGNLNATPAIVRSAVLYVLRLLVGEALPLNDGLLRPIDLRIPPGLLAPEFGGDPATAPAIMAGNVETSQRLVDVLLAAVGAAAAAQGTMNNLVFGDETFGYYETIGGGTGAGPGFAGADGVHSHMTNTRITDAELLEHRYPVRLHRFAIRRGSGGAGAYRGGDGLVRELEFLRPMQLAIVSQRRTRPPRGMNGGGDGAPGRQVLVTAAGERRELEGIDGTSVAPGDRLTVETPGGGGWG